jgi:hypothetical protein
MAQLMYRTTTAKSSGSTSNVPGSHPLLQASGCAISARPNPGARTRAERQHLPEPRLEVLVEEEEEKPGRVILSGRLEVYEEHFLIFHQVVATFA